MISLDTNIILSALNPKDAQHENAVSLLEELSGKALFISPPVYAELRAGPGWSLVEAFLDQFSIRLQDGMPLPVWKLAGERFGLYAHKRREVKKKRKTPLPPPHPSRLPYRFPCPLPRPTPGHL